MNIRQLDLLVPTDFAHFQLSIRSLYVELFGEAAAPEDGLLEHIVQKGQGGAARHWVFAALGGTDFGDAEDSGLRGLVTLAESFAAFAGGPYLILGELWVAPEHRSRGVGAELIRFCQTFAHERGYGRVDVTAPSDPKWDRTYSFL